jgi:hypothetical protein
MCRRCGAPLHHDDSEDARLMLPAGLARRRAGAGLANQRPGASPVAPGAIAAPAFGSSRPDNLLPGAMPRPDNLLSRASRPRPIPPPAPPSRSAKARTRVGAIAGKHWRRILVLVVVAIALVVSLVEVWPVVFRSDATPAASSAAQYARATALLRTVAGGGRTLFAPNRSFAGVSPAQLSARSYKVAIVASTTRARVGQVSMRVTSATVMTLATPADAQRCVFARDEPLASGTRFVTVRTADCRAAQAPAAGWNTP